MVCGLPLFCFPQNFPTARTHTGPHKTCCQRLNKGERRNISSIFLWRDFHQWPIQLPADAIQETFSVNSSLFRVLSLQFRGMHIVLMTQCVWIKTFFTSLIARSGAQTGELISPGRKLQRAEPTVILGRILSYFRQFATAQPFLPPQSRRRADEKKWNVFRLKLQPIIKKRKVFI